jgi:hypothetical protein
MRGRAFTVLHGTLLAKVCTRAMRAMLYPRRCDDPKWLSDVRQPLHPISRSDIGVFHFARRDAVEEGGGVGVVAVGGGGLGGFAEAALGFFGF